MEEIYVIEEHDLIDNEHSVIGVCTSTASALSMMKDFYGEYEEIKYRDIRDSGLEWSRLIQIDDGGESPYLVTVYLKSYTLDHL